MKHAIVVLLLAALPSLTGCDSSDRVVVIYMNGEGEPGGPAHHQAGAAKDAGPAMDTVAARERPPSEDAVSEPGIPSCPARPTTHITLVGNLDSTSSTPSGRWSLSDPTGTSNFNTSLVVYSASGAAAQMDIYFARAGEGVWEYHAVLDLQHNPVELGSGVFEFSGWGALVHREVRRELRVPDLDGQLGPVINVDLGKAQDEGGDGFSGITSFAEATSLSVVRVDGTGGTIGRACGKTLVPEVQSGSPPAPVIATGSAPDGGLDPRTFPSCPGEPTTQMLLRGNLDATALSVSDQDPRPDFEWTYSTILRPYNASGAPVDIEIFFVKTDDRAWDFQITLGWHRDGFEVTSGKLEFDPQGRLASRTLVQPLRLPDPSGQLGPVIDLGLGAPLDKDGNGLDGITGFAAPSDIACQMDGAAPLVGSTCAEARQQADLASQTSPQQPGI